MFLKAGISSLILPTCSIRRTFVPELGQGSPWVSMTETNEFLSHDRKTKETTQLELGCGTWIFLPKLAQNDLDFTAQSREEFHIHHPIRKSFTLLLCCLSLCQWEIEWSDGGRWIYSAVQRAKNQVIIVTPSPESFQKSIYKQLSGAIKIFLFFFFFFSPPFSFTTEKSLTNNHFTLYSSSIKAITPGYVIN